MRTKIDTSALDLRDNVVTIKRVRKVVEGGRTMRFAALVVVGDGNGHVGVGLGKATEIPDAIRKGKDDAIKNIIKVDLNENGSLYHEIYGKFGGATVLLKPAPEGTGIIAGGPARAVLELAGFKNIRTKSLGSRNKRNVVSATIDGLANSTSPEKIAKLRGKTTLVKSTIGAIPKHRKTVQALGLNKLHSTVEQQDNAAIRGMLNQVKHLVKVEEI